MTGIVGVAPVPSGNDNEDENADSDHEDDENVPSFLSSSGASDSSKSLIMTITIVI